MICTGGGRGGGREVGFFFLQMTFSSRKLRSMTPYIRIFSNFCTYSCIGQEKKRMFYKIFSKYTFPFLSNMCNEEGLYISARITSEQSDQLFFFFTRDVSREDLSLSTSRKSRSQRGEFYKIDRCTFFLHQRLHLLRSLGVILSFRVDRFPRHRPPR